MRYYDKSDYLAHYGILGMKWGIRRYQNADGSLTGAGRRRYGIGEARKAVSEWISTKKKERTRAKALKKAAKTRKANAKEKERLAKEQKEIDRIKRETDALNAKTALLRAKIAEKDARRARRQQMLPKFLRDDKGQNQNQQNQKSENFAWKATKEGLASVITTSIKNALTFDPSKITPSDEELDRRAVAEGTREGLKNRARDEASRGTQAERMSDAIFEGRMAGAKQKAQDTAANDYSYQEIAARNARSGWGAGIKAATTIAAKDATESAIAAKAKEQQSSAISSYADVLTQMTTSDFSTSTVSNGSSAIDDVFWNLDIDYND